MGAGLPDGTFWRTIVSREVHLATAIFSFLHRDCGEDVTVYHSEKLLSCWCGRCEDVRTYEVLETAP